MMHVCVEDALRELQGDMIDDNQTQGIAVD